LPSPAFKYYVYLQDKEPYSMDRTATEMTRGELLLLLSPAAHFNSVYRLIGLTPDGDEIHNVGGTVFHLKPGYIYPDALTQAAADPAMDMAIQTAMPLETMEKFRHGARAIPFSRLTDIWTASGCTVLAVDPRPASVFPGTKAYRRKIDAIMKGPL
jgi:hypothetical protein